MRIIAAGCLSVVLQAVTPPAPQVQLPAIALEAAVAGEVPLAYILARSGVPAGVSTTHNPSDFAFARRTKGFDATPAVSLTDVLDRFRQSHPDHRVELRDGVVRLTERESACAPATASTMVGPMTYSGDVSKVMVFLTWLVRKQQGQPRGTTGSILGDTAELSQQLPAVSYALEQPVSMERAFDKAVTMGKGVWLVWQRQRPDGRVGCRSVAYWSNGLVSAPEEDFYTAPSAASR